MLCIKNIIDIVSALIIIKYSYSLEESFLDSDILRTEAVIRNTTNKLFATLKLKRDNPRLSNYLITIQHFASLTLQDHDTLNKIAKISRVDNKSNNGSIVFITAINELWTDGNRNFKNNEANIDVATENDHDHVGDIIENFLRRLKDAKEVHEINTSSKINQNVLNIIKGASHVNTTLDKYENYFANETVLDAIEFWKPSSRRIYRGERTKIKHFPFMASIQIFNSFQCGGSIIKSDLIITASSCLQLAWNNRFYRENPAFLSVRVGSSFYSGGGEVIPVLEVYFHPNYNPKNLRHNLCIVRLSRKIKFRWRARRRVRKIDIDRHDNGLPFDTPGIVILGWGAKGQSNVVRDPWQNILSYAVLSVYPIKDCQDVYSTEYVTHKNFCAGFISKGGGACNRDIGGPGIDEGKLMGVVSFGSPVCGAADAPTVFTKLGYYADWIDSIMEQEVPYSKKRTTLQSSKSPYPFMLEQAPSTSTTYKIPPLTGDITTPIPINEIENILRMFDDDLFKEFLNTMFDSKEKSEYQDVFKDAKQSLDSEIQKDEINKYEYPEVTSPYIDYNVETVTKLIDFEADSGETATELKFKISSEGENKNDLTNSVSNLDIKRIIEDTVPENKQKAAKGFTESVFEELEKEPPGDQNNETVLTLLYLSEENKDKVEDYKRSGETATELSIPGDPFQDLTRSKDKNKNNFEVLPETELYEILSEVIDDEILNKN